jgi:predicted O-linked N-acetylglucosamine transferase (SPINDLY family)
VASPNQLADALIAEGNKAEDSGSIREACERYREAVAAAPAYARAHLNLGIGLEASGQAPEARREFETALELEPQNPFVSYNLGNLLLKQGDLERAENLLREALTHKPEFPEAHVALSNILIDRGDEEGAEAALRAALNARPDYVGALYNQARMLRGAHRLSEAEVVLRGTLAIEPQYLPALELLANVLRSQSRIGEALDCYATARRLAPGKIDIRSAELFTLNFVEDISPEALFARHKAFGEQLERAVPRKFLAFPNAKDPERRLRVGYLSGDFWRHPVALFAIPVIERSTEEVFCYSTGGTPDEVTQTLREAADVFHDVHAMSDDELADAIHRDRVDILVDLSGHTGEFRLGVLARQPAPVQATWLGYLNTTGLSRVHYRICDAFSDPAPVADELHTETLVRLPHSQWCYRPFIPDVPTRGLPSKQNGFVTFGSFNQIAKVSSGIRRLWAEILKRLPDSRLLVAGVSDGPARDGLLADLEAVGVSPARIATVPHAVLAEFLHSIGGVDIALDTTPYSGGTTTCDALWMGVPVVALHGTRSISRSAASILSSVGLGEWIAATPEEYVRRAVEFAGDIPRLDELRGTLREKMRSSPIMDETAFVRGLENAYRMMWRTWCEGRHLQHP